MFFWLFFFALIAELSAGLSSEHSNGARILSRGPAETDHDSPVLIEGLGNASQGLTPDWGETYANSGGEQDANEGEPRLTCETVYSFYGPLRNNLWWYSDDWSDLYGHLSWFQRIMTVKQNRLLSSGGIFSNPGFKDYLRGQQVMHWTANHSPAELTLPGDEELALGYDTLALLVNEFDPRPLWNAAAKSPLPMGWLASNLNHPKNKDRHVFQEYAIQSFENCASSWDAPWFQIIVGIVVKDLMADRVPTEIWKAYEVNDDYNDVLDRIKLNVTGEKCKPPDNPDCRAMFAVMIHDGPTIGGIDLETELKNPYSTFAKFVKLMMERRDVELIFAGHVDRQLIWDCQNLSDTNDQQMRIVSSRYDPESLNNGGFVYKFNNNDSTLTYNPNFFDAEYSSYILSPGDPDDRIQYRDPYAPLIEGWLAEQNSDKLRVKALAEEIVTPLLTYHENGTAFGCTLCQTLADALLWGGRRFALSDQPPDVAIVGPGDMVQSVENNTRLGLYGAIPAIEFVVTMKLKGSELIMTLGYQFPQDGAVTNDYTLQYLTTAGFRDFNNADWLKPASEIDAVLHLSNGTKIDEDAEYTIIATTNTTTRSHSRFMPMWDADKFVTTWRPFELMEKYLASPQYEQLNPSWGAYTRDEVEEAETRWMREGLPQY